MCKRSARWISMVAFLQTLLIRDVTSVHLGERVKIPGDPGTNVQAPVIRRIHGGVHIETAEISHNGAIGRDHTGRDSHTDRQGPSGALRVNSGVGNTYVDLPGQDGNESSFQMVHRDMGHGVGEIHVDLPGQHGNNSPFPIIHRVNDSRVPHRNDNALPMIDKVNLSQESPGGRQDSSNSKDMRGFEKTTISSVPVVGAEVHVDLPGQHGNNSPHPVVHRTGSSPIIVEAGHVPNGGMHGGQIAQPGHQGNDSSPVVLRVDQTQGIYRSRQDSVRGELLRGFDRATISSMPHFIRKVLPNFKRKIHIDLPDQHGNSSSNPVVHRTGSSPIIVEANHGLNGEDRVVNFPQESPGGRQDSSNSKDMRGFEKTTISSVPVVGAEVHVDLAGQHGNNSPHPVVHRTGSSPIIVEAGHVPNGGMHGGQIDQPGHHGNDSPSVVQRVDQTQGIYRSRQDGFRGKLLRGFDRGTSSSMPYFIRKVLPNFIRKVHVDLPVQHGSNSSHPVVLRTVSPHYTDEAGLTPHSNGKTVHAEQPGQHGNDSLLPVVNMVDRMEGNLRVKQDSSGGKSRRGSETPPISSYTDFKGKVLMDMPAQYRNNSNPVAYRPGSPPNIDEAGHVPHGASKEINLDQPGYHRNDSNPVVQRVIRPHGITQGRQDSSRGKSMRGLASSSVQYLRGKMPVDLHSQLGNNVPPPPHRTGYSPYTDKAGLAPHGGDRKVHTEQLGKHINDGPLPVANMAVRPHGSPQGKQNNFRAKSRRDFERSPISRVSDVGREVNVDLPGHRTWSPPCINETDNAPHGGGRNVAVDQPGQHGNDSALPVVNPVDRSQSSLMNGRESFLNKRGPPISTFPGIQRFPQTERKQVIFERRFRPHSFRVPRFPGRKSRLRMPTDMFADDDDNDDDIDDDR
ncbi:hypothetical protein MAR_015815 [Mya arenaria]|uniref:Uncharacterized protein n=1 Tax=Mya arenaria TaxID=6604 RepID=A0ABY7FLN3_MYAAR|nr:hypothetical protein MAR_015815 [Mya arenaria]